MKRRGLINWKEKLSAAPPAQQTISQLLPSIDMPAGQPSHSPTRATSRLGRQQTSTTSPGFSKAPIEFKASLSIHVQETNVLTAGLSGSDSQEIFLGDNEHFQEGDFVEVTPIGSEETSNRTTSGTGNSGRRRNEGSRARNAASISKSESNSGSAIQTAPVCKSCRR